MIQFNLLPDVKMQYIRARKMKRLLIGLSAISASVSLGLVILLFVAVGIFQKNNMDDLSKDITKNVNSLQNTKDLDKILTVQNQLSSLPALNDGKPASTRLFGYLAQITPGNVTISKANVDFAAQTMTIDGNAASFLDVNRFVDTLKFTNYAIEGEQGDGTLAFSKVILGSFSTDDKTNSASYSVTMIYERDIFDNLKNVKLSVPQTVTTRSAIEKPGALFKQSPAGTGSVVVQ